MNRDESPGGHRRAAVGESAGKRSLAAALISDGSGRNLVVKPSYRTTWTLPGGVVEEGESPMRACRGRIQDALGITVPVGRLLCVDWMPPREDSADGYTFIFDVGEAPAADVAQVRLNPAEFEDIRFIAATDLDASLAPAETRRVRGAITARAKGGTCYLDNGENPLSQMVMWPSSCDGIHNGIRLRLVLSQ